MKNFLRIALALILAFSQPLAAQAQYTQSPFAGVGPTNLRDTFAGNGTTWAAESIARKTGILQQNTKGGTTFGNFGIGAPTATGTPTGVTTNGRNCIRFTSAAVLNSIGGTSYTTGNTALELTPIITFVIVPSTTADVRYWVGVFSGAPDASDAPAVHKIAVRWSTSVPDTNFKFITSAAGSQTVVDTGVALASGTTYVIQFDCTDVTTPKCYINGVLVGTSTTNLPTSTQALNLYCQVVTLEVVGTSAIIDISKETITQN